MYVLFVVLNQTECLDEILEKFIQVGVTGATVLDSQGMGSAIVHGDFRSIPMFGSLKTIMDGAHPYNKTIFTVLKNEECVEKAVAAVQEVMEEQEITPDGLGFMFSVPIGKVYEMTP